MFEREVPKINIKNFNLLVVAGHSLPHQRLSSCTLQPPGQQGAHTPPSFGSIFFLFTQLNSHAPQTTSGSRRRLLAGNSHKTGKRTQSQAAYGIVLSVLCTAQ
jgi:hypothetical protein